MKVPLLILGAGPTGIGAAMRAQELGLDWRLLEAAETPGGLASSFVDENGFTWDLGGHVQFSHYAHFDAAMDRALGPDGWLTHERESWIRFQNRWIPYPFQYNLHRLSDADRDRCLAGLQSAGGPPPANFDEWILRSFGDGVAELFLRPYNRKVWACDPTGMDFQWIGERVAAPDLAKVLHGIRTGEDAKSWGPNATFRFPKHGGTGAVWKALAAELPPERCHYGDAVVEIDPIRRTVRTRGGKSFGYSRLVSTLPLDTLIRLCPGVVAAETAERFVFSTTHVVGVGLEGQPPPELRGKCWMYFPGANSPYYRVTVFSHYSPYNVPKPGEQWSLMTETAESRTHPVDAGGLVAATLRALAEDGLIPDLKAVISTTQRLLPKGYPTPFLGRDRVVDPVLRAFEAHEIFSRGRFGAWKYEVSNQDHSFAQGRECVERLHAGGGAEWEPTLRSAQRGTQT